MRSCSTLERGLMATMVLAWWLDVMTLEDFSSSCDSMMGSSFLFSHAKPSLSFCVCSQLQFSILVMHDMKHVGTFCHHSSLLLHVPRQPFALLAPLPLPTSSKQLSWTTYSESIGKRSSDHLTQHCHHSGNTSEIIFRSLFQEMKSQGVSSLPVTPPVVLGVSHCNTILAKRRETGKG